MVEFINKLEQNGGRFEKLSFRLFTVPSILPYDIQKSVRELNEEYIKLRDDADLTNEVITLAYKMIGRVGLTIYINGYEISDNLPRIHKGRFIKIAHIKSENNLIVRGTTVDTNELYFVLPHNCTYYGTVNEINPNKIDFNGIVKINSIEQFKEIAV